MSVFNPTVIKKCEMTGAMVVQTSPNLFKVSLNKRGTYVFNNKASALSYFEKYKGRSKSELRMIA